MNKYYYICETDDTGSSTDPIVVFTSKYNEGTDQRIFFGDKVGVTTVEAEEQPEVTEEVTYQTEEQLYEITDPNLINYGWDAESYLKPIPTREN